MNKDFGYIEHVALSQYPSLHCETRKRGVAGYKLQRRKRDEDRRKRSMQ